jgi:hypothetical protein
MARAPAMAAGGERWGREVYPRATACDRDCWAGGSNDLLVTAPRSRGTRVRCGVSTPYALEQP